jgi:hypothetical protein
MKQAGGREMTAKLLFSHDDFADIFDPVDDTESENNFHNKKEPEEVDISSKEYIESIYYKVFGISNIPDRDMDIIKTYCNEKSFERAISVCHRLLQNFSDKKSENSNVISMDTQIIIESHNTLLDFRIPHIYKPGMLILKVLYRNGNT